MTQRPDALNVSLGPEWRRYKPAIRALALALTGPGRKGDGSISQLAILLARLMLAGPEETVAALSALRVRLLDPMVRDEAGKIVSFRLYDDDGRPFTLADARAASPAAPAPRGLSLIHISEPTRPY